MHKLLLIIDHHLIILLKIKGIPMLSNENTKQKCKNWLFPLQLVMLDIYEIKKKKRKTLTVVLTLHLGWVLGKGYIISCNNGCYDFPLNKCGK